MLLLGFSSTWSQHDLWLTLFSNKRLNGIEILVHLIKWFELVVWSFRWLVLPHRGDWHIPLLHVPLWRSSHCVRHPYWPRSRRRWRRVLWGYRVSRHEGLLQRWLHMDLVHSMWNMKSELQLQFEYLEILQALENKIWMYYTLSSQTYRTYSN